MLNLNQIEFQKRLEQLARARKIFTPHLTKDISVAFELYQELLAEQKLEHFMSNMVTRLGVPLRFYQKYFVPSCPKCGSRLSLRRINTKPGSKANFHGWRTVWVCEHGDCIFHEYSKKTPLEWMKELERKARKHGNRGLRGVQSGGKSVLETRCC